MNAQEIKAPLTRFKATLPATDYVAQVLENYLNPGHTRVDPREAATEVFKHIKRLNELLEIGADRMDQVWHQEKTQELEALRAVRKHYIEKYYGLSLF